MTQTTLAYRLATEIRINGFQVSDNEGNRLKEIPSDIEIFHVVRSWDPDFPSDDRGQITATFNQYLLGDNQEMITLTTYGNDEHEEWIDNARTLRSLQGLAFQRISVVRGDTEPRFELRETPQGNAFAESLDKIAYLDDPEIYERRKRNAWQTR